MPLKYKFKKSEEASIPADQKSLYAVRTLQENGQAVEYLILDVEGVVERSRLDEFRTNNIELQKKLTEMTELFEGIDPVQARELVKIKDKLDSKKLVDSGKLDEAVDLRVQDMKKEHTKALAKITEENARLLEHLSRVEIQQATVTAGTKFGLRSTAVLDLTARAGRIFKLENGKPVAKGEDGKAIYGKDGVEGLTIAEWVEKQVVEAPHLFEPNSGGGAQGGGAGGSGGGGGEANPFAKATWNLTNQMRITKSDPTKAARLKAAAGGK